MVDNMMVHHKAWQAKLLEMGLALTLEEVREQIHGVNEEILRRLFGDRFNSEEIQFHAADKEKRYRDIFLPELKLINGLDQILSSLYRSDVTMGIGTAAPRENLDFVLDQLDIRKYFSAALHAGDVSIGKPNPEIFLKVAERMQISPENCIVFEDSPTGAEAAYRAGCRSVIVTTTHNPSEFQHLSNIIKFIDDYTTLDPYEL